MITTLKSPYKAIEPSMDPPPLIIMNTYGPYLTLNLKQPGPDTPKPYKPYTVSPDSGGFSSEVPGWGACCAGYWPACLRRVASTRRWLKVWGLRRVIDRIWGPSKYNVQ